MILDSQKKCCFYKTKRGIYFQTSFKMFDTKKPIKIEINLLNLEIKAYFIQKYNDK